MQDTVSYGNQLDWQFKEGFLNLMVVMDAVNTFEIRGWKMGFSDYLLKVDQKECDSLLRKSKGKPNGDLWTSSLHLFDGFDVYALRKYLPLPTPQPVPPAPKAVQTVSYQQYRGQVVAALGRDSLSEAFTILEPLLLKIRSNLEE